MNYYATIGLVLAIIPVMCPPERTEVTQEEFRALKGKSYEEVVAVLGCPSSIRKGEGAGPVDASFYPKIRR